MSLDSKAVDLNCDMGESFGRYKLGYDEEIMQCITSANIACGYHAGDPVVIRRTVEMAAQNGVGIGAHPSFPDLQGFGRRRMAMDKMELKDFLIYQIGAVKIFAEVWGPGLQHVKIHGALNNMAAEDREIADVVAESIACVDEELIFVAVAGSQMEYAGRAKGLKVAREFFADRNYDSAGNLVSRSSPQAHVEDDDLALARTIRAVQEGKVEAVDGSELHLEVDTICLHGDSPSALKFARKIKTGLLQAGIKLRPLGTFGKK